MNRKSQSSKFTTILASIPDDGMHLEVKLSDNDKDSYDSLAILGSFRADKEGEIFFETDDGAFSIPLEEFERVIKLAKEEVHSEDYYP